MYKYKIGQIVDAFKYHAEEVFFDIANDGAAMLVFFKDPTSDEIQQFSAGTNFEIRFTELYGVIMITVKIGSLNWMDAPYTPHLSHNLTNYEFSTKNQGLALTLFLIDANSGEVKHIRLLGLSEEFTKRLFNLIVAHKAKTFSQTEYASSLRRIFTTYLTSEIVKLSKDYCKIGD